MAKAEISWKGRTAEGVRRQVYARRVGREWRFYVREKRYDCWEAMPEPPLEDWLELLDGVRRRVARRLLTPGEEDRLLKRIRERFPEAGVA
ncbi:MAG TPA: hypothetical protein VMS21_10775 [Methylomirabilota bacterium]|nr:hypothetical protein [Methylomirabilota bacterium]